MSEFGAVLFRSWDCYRYFILNFNWTFACVSQTRNLTFRANEGGIVFFCLPHDRAKIKHKSVPGRLASPGQCSTVKGWISKTLARDPVQRSAIIPSFRSMNGSARWLSFGHCNCQSWREPSSCPAHYLYILNFSDRKESLVYFCIMSTLRITTKWQSFLALTDIRI